MATKLWEKGTKINALIESFTVGKDLEMDLFLAEFDVVGSLAHIQMLEKIGLITSAEFTILSKELNKRLHEIGYAGTKDKCAWTCQRISLFDPDLEKIKNFHHQK